MADPAPAALPDPSSGRLGRNLPLSAVPAPRETSTCTLWSSRPGTALPAKGRELSLLGFPAYARGLSGVGGPGALPLLMTKSSALACGGEAYFGLLLRHFGRLARVHGGLHHALRGVQDRVPHFGFLVAYMASTARHCAECQSVCNTSTFSLASREASTCSSWSSRPGTPLPAKV